MATLKGWQGKLYYKIGGLSGGGSFVELTNCKDVSAKRSKSEVDVSTRADLGNEAIETALRSSSLTFQMIIDDTDQNYLDLANAEDQDTKVGMKFLQKAGGRGFQCDMVILDFSEDQPLNEAQMVNVEMKRTRGAALTVLTSG